MSKKFIYYGLIGCIIIGILMRFYNLRYNSQFTWDQENSLAFPARDILINHHFPLIGAKTGIGDLYLSPYYSYVIALFYWIFRLDPIAGAVSAGVFSILTMFSGFVLIKNNIDKKTAFYFVLLWSVIPFIVSQDRIPWNVNLFPLATLFVIFGLWSAIIKKKKTGFIMMGAGLFLGVNAHFSIILLSLMVIVLLFLYKELRRYELLFVFILAMIGILPLVLFNYRHNNLLLNNFVNFLFSFPTPTDTFIFRVIQVGKIHLGIIGKILLPEAASWGQQMMGFLFILAVFIYRKHSSMRIYAYFYYYLSVLYFVFFSIYKGAIPEYYFNGIITLTLVGIALFISNFLDRFLYIRLLIVVIAVVYLLQSIAAIQQMNPASIGVKQDVVKLIRDDTSENDFRVIYDMDLGWQFGYDYLFSYYSLDKHKIQDTQRIYWISYPKSRFPGNPDALVSQIAIGYPDTSSRIFATKEADFYTGLFRMRVPKTWMILSCPSIDFDSFIISPDKSTNCINAYVGIKITNIPNCTISQFEGNRKINLKNGLEMYEGNSQNTLIVFIEKDRCVQFIDISKQENFKPDLIELLESLRLKAR